MKNLSAHHAILIACLLSVISCRKRMHESNRFNEQALIEAAKRHFSDSVISFEILSQAFASKDERKLQTAGRKRPLWEQAHVELIRSLSVVVVPIEYADPFFAVSNFNEDWVFRSEHLSSMLVYTDANKKTHTELLTIYPSNTFENRRGEAYSGIITVENWNGSNVRKYKFESSGAVKRYMPAQASLNIIKPSGSSEVSVTSTVKLCYEATGYNYVKGNPNNGYSWTIDLGCETHYFYDQPGSGGTAMTGYDYGRLNRSRGTGGGIGFRRYRVYSGDNVIGNIRDYNKCFTNVPGLDYSYKVTVCVSQPEPGTRNTWGFSGKSSSGGNLPVSVGHVFLILDQATPNKRVVRNVGFYPSNSVDPFSPYDDGQLNNDANRTYNIALEINTTNSQFFTILNFINDNANLKYDLNSNNCTSFVLNALSAGGFHLPRTIGSWTNGSGYNPGDLGEDIRRMPLQPNMTRKTTPVGHPNVGNCY